MPDNGDDGYGADTVQSREVSSAEIIFVRRSGSARVAAGRLRVSAKLHSRPPFASQMVVIAGAYGTQAQRTLLAVTAPALDGALNDFGLAAGLAPQGGEAGIT